MKVLLTNLPWKGADYAVRAGARWAHTFKTKGEVVSFRPFPFFIACAAALLEKNNHEVKVIDALAENLTDQEFFIQVKEFNPDYIVAETATTSYDNDKEYLKKLKKETKSKIILCGQHATALPQDVYCENSGIVDHILVGEYEFILKNLVEGKIKDPIVKNKELVAIDTIPWPARHLFKMHLYNETFCANAPNIQMMASRGCYFKCSYCNTFLLYGGRNYRFRDPQDIVDEMEFCIDKYSPREIYFDDDFINGKPEELEKMCDIKISRGIKIPFSAMSHASIPEKTLIKMAEAGCRALKFGVESADEAVLAKLGKGVTIVKIIKIANLCKKLKIKTHLTYTVGLPGDTKETIKKTLKFALKYGDQYQISIATPFPGTPLYQEAKKEGWLEAKGWQDFDGAKKSIIGYPNLSNKEIFELYELGRISFYRKTLESGEYLKYIKMSYQEGGFKNLFKLFLRGPEIAKNIIKSKKNI